MKNQASGLWLRGKTYWLAATLEGFGRIRVSLKTGDLAEAIQEARLVRAYPERHFNREKGDLIELFLAHQNRKGISRARIDLSRIVLDELTRVTESTLDRVTAAAAGRWWTALLARVKPKSAKDYLGVVTVFYRWAIDAGHCKSSPVALIIPPKIRPQPRRVFLRPEDALRVLDAATEDDLRFAIFCGLHCGLRRGEVIASRPHWFDLQSGLLHVQNEADWLTKDRDNRTIPLTAEFREFLTGYGLRSPYMFRPDVKPKATNKSWRYRTDFAKQFSGHMDRLGLGYVTFHDLRRTFASLLASSGVSIFKISKWLGDDVSVVEGTYGHLIPNDDDINRSWNNARLQNPKE